MADMKEKLEEGSSSPTGTVESDISLPQSKGFEPIASNSKANSRSNSHARNHTTSLRSISRTRSNNGYGCDEGDDSSEEGTGDVETAQAEKDPFEVRWDGGDSDPLCPRSMTMARKWLVVLIVSASSLCV